jgi:tetrahydromethanopterin S-methyltransferase subunit F
VVTAIAYMSAYSPAREKILKDALVPQMLQAISESNEMDQKMQLIALNWMLFQGVDVQRTFIVEHGMTKLVFLLQKPDPLFH